MKYKTKPFTIEAIQWTGDNVDEIRAFVGRTANDEEGFLLPDDITGVWENAHVWDYLQTVWVPVNPNDYIIKGMKGEFYPCDEEVFESKYELLEEGNWDCHLPRPRADMSGPFPGGN